jgi:hypothetical protein
VTQQLYQTFDLDHVRHTPTNRRMRVAGIVCEPLDGGAPEVLQVAELMRPLSSPHFASGGGSTGQQKYFDDDD